jgi:type IV pilus assembly protein PilX
MVIALITLSVLLIGAAVAMRSMNVTLGSVGNFGFKRDMANRAEQGIRAAADALNTGALFNEGARQTSNVAQNYSATILPTDASGIPLAMLNVGSSPASLNGLGNAAREITVPTESIRIHYLIDRLCNTVGPFSTTNCLVTGEPPPGGNDPDGLKPDPQVTYRITVRVMGPNNAFSFFQSTYTTQMN